MMITLMIMSAFTCNRKRYVKAESAVNTCQQCSRLSLIGDKLLNTSRTSNDSMQLCIKAHSWTAHPSWRTVFSGRTCSTAHICKYRLPPITWLQLTALQQVEKRAPVQDVGEDQTKHPNGENKLFKWLWMHYPSWCQMVCVRISNIVDLLEISQLSSWFRGNVCKG